MAAELLGREAEVHHVLTLNRTAEADDELTRGQQQGEYLSQAYQSWYQAAAARVRLLDGRWDDALAAVEAAGVVPGLSSIARVIWLRRGDQSRCAASQDEPNAGHFADISGWAEALMEEARGRSDSALETLYGVWERVIGLPIRPMPHVLCPDLVRLAVSLGEIDRADKVATVLEEAISADSALSVRATVALCRGLADGNPLLLVRAAHDFAAAYRPLQQGIALEALATVSAAAGDASQARESLESAQTVYGRLGATWDISRAAASLRPFGIRRGVRGKRQRPKFGWEALTDTERRIAAMVAEGKSNPAIATHMFISRRTVQTHVSSILAKLGLRSRIEVAVEVVRNSSQSATALR
jgi:DNA-binding CsgD family transcriptional regulator